MEHDPEPSDFATAGGPRFIEYHVFINGRAIILPNIQISKGAVVATSSVVTKEVPACAIAGGAPAKVIGERTGYLR